MGRAEQNPRSPCPPAVCQMGPGLPAIARPRWGLDAAGSACSVTSILPTCGMANCNRYAALPCPWNTTTPSADAPAWCNVPETRTSRSGPVAHSRNTRACSTTRMRTGSSGTGAHEMLHRHTRQQAWAGCCRLAWRTRLTLVPTASTHGHRRLGNKSDDRHGQRTACRCHTPADYRARSQTAIHRQYPSGMRATAPAAYAILDSQIAHVTCWYPCWCRRCVRTAAAATGSTAYSTRGTSRQASSPAHRSRRRLGVFLNHPIFMAPGASTSNKSWQSG